MSDAGERYSVEQIVAKLREAQRLPAQADERARVRAPEHLGPDLLSLADQYGALKEDEAPRLKALEAENVRLKKIVAEQRLDISRLWDVERGSGESDPQP